ncbi:MAG: hypothetical protein OXD50_14010 [Chloroflexi bacterium]|nr:hypothetical protein [Chloroflexota bacterium]
MRGTASQRHSRLPGPTSAIRIPRPLSGWEEFLADQPEQPKPRGRRNPRPSGRSLFDWALEREQHAGLTAAGG